MSVREDMFRAAGAYHAALASYSRAMRRGEEIEHLAQQVIGTSLHYRLAIEKVMQQAPADAASCRRLRALRRLLHHASWKYNARKRAEKTVVLQAL
jgi:hypothetical protein